MLIDGETEIDIDEIKQKLIALGADTLAQALMDLAFATPLADEKLTSLISTSDENILRFKSKLEHIKQTNHYYDWKEAASFARKLELMLTDIQGSVTDPYIGLELTALFFESDNDMFEICDDSHGDVGDVFRFAAVELFVDFASRCEDKNKVEDILFRVLLKNEYGARDELVDVANKFLEEERMKSLIGRFQKQIDLEQDDYVQRGLMLHIESLAKQSGNIDLFMKSRFEKHGELKNFSKIDIAEMYLDQGQTDLALQWVNQTTGTDPTFREYEKERILKRIYRMQGKTDEMAELLSEQFYSTYSLERLDELLEVIGEDKRQSIVEKAIQTIRSSIKWSYSAVEFLAAVGEIDELEEYLLKRAGQLNGYNYYSMLGLAEVLESEHKYVAASLTYRALLDSILERGASKAYHYGARYLKKLDKMERNISDWMGFTSHEVYKTEIRKTHSRKKSFWNEYQ